MRSHSGPSYLSIHWQMVIPVLRLGVRSELWSAEERAVLEGHRVVVAGSSPPLLAALRNAGYAAMPLGSDLGAGDVLVLKLSSLDELVVLVDRLLGPGGCPWDQAQTHESLKRHLLEEAYEVLEAIDSGESDTLTEELGDLLLQPIMHGQISRANGGFDAEDVARVVVDKLIRRHPHVFGDIDVADADEVLRNWDQIKAAEKGAAPASLLAGVPKGMASLLRAYEVSKRAARAGFEWPDLKGVWEKLAEEEGELREAHASGDPDRIASEVGDLLFTVVNLARWMGVEPEECLRKMLNRFTDRFTAMEAMADRPLAELSLPEWDALWNRAKEAART